MEFERVPIILFTLLFIAVIGVATFLALDSLDDQLVNNVAGCGRNATGGTAGTILYSSCPEGWNATQKISEGVGNTFDQAPTWGTLIGVGVLIGIIASFMLIGGLGYGYAKRKGYL